MRKKKRPQPPSPTAKRQQVLLGRLTELATVDTYLSDMERMADRLYDDLFKRLVRDRKREPRKRKAA